jgi:ABC-type transporter Mla subunit MlaD
MSDLVECLNRIASSIERSEETLDHIADSLDVIAAKLTASESMRALTSALIASRRKRG